MSRHCVYTFVGALQRLKGGLNVSTKEEIMSEIETQKVCVYMCVSVGEKSTVKQPWKKKIEINVSLIIKERNCK